MLTVDACPLLDVRSSVRRLDGLRTSSGFGMARGFGFGALLSTAEFDLGFKVTCVCDVVGVLLGRVKFSL